MSVTSFNPDDFDLLALDELIESYDFETDLTIQTYYADVEKSLCQKISAYGKGINDYGAIMEAHLRRTSEYGRDFLVYLGFSKKAANNFYHANLLQDLGKIHPDFDISLWSLTTRPTQEQKKEKRLHVPRGYELFMQSLPMAVHAHPHAILTSCIILFHHEKHDGTGLYGKKGDKMGKVIKTVCIVDSKDGDMIVRPHQNHTPRSEEEALLRMKTDEKYAGAFDVLLDEYISFRNGKR